MYNPSTKEIEDFVRDSNAIEGYTAESVRERYGIEYEDSPFWTSHVTAVERVLWDMSMAHAQPIPLPSARIVHSALMHGIPDIDPGSISHAGVGAWRDCGVTVGGHSLPKPYLVPRLMEAWEHVGSGVVREASALEPKQRAEACAFMHYHFECVHPFVDGNGRTGRLLWNAMRLACGLDWHIVRADKRWDYYKDIQAWRSSRWDAISYKSLHGQESDIHIAVGKDGV